MFTLSLSGWLRKWSYGLCAVLCYFLMGSVVWSKPSTPPHGTSQASDKAQLAELSRESVVAQNDVLTTGNIEVSLRKKTKAALYRDALQSQFARLVNRKNILSQKGIDYKSHRTEVKIKKTKINGAHATQIAVEHVVLALDPSIGGPTETEYIQEHAFEYVKEGSRWRMVSHRVLPPPEMVIEKITVPASLPSTVDAPEGYQSAIGMVEGQITPEDESSGLAVHYENLLGATYSRSSAVDYALKYWGPYNSNYNTSQYRTYTNDCTNFTSQVLRSGSWPMDTTGSRTASDTWYYGSYTFTTSYSWAGAHNFNQFLHQSGRGFAARYFQDMSKGDLLQADFGPTPDGNISHSMVVTSKDSSNRIYLSYHTYNTKNRSIDDLRLAYPGTRWYGLRMYVGF